MQSLKYGSTKDFSGSRAPAQGHIHQKTSLRDNLIKLERKHFCYPVMDHKGLRSVHVFSTLIVCYVCAYVCIYTCIILILMPTVK